MENKISAIPNCVGFIMDGNRRWAKDNNLPELDGHKKGFDLFEETIEWCKELGINNLIFYTFSTENWGRDKKEISHLMNIFITAFEKLDKIKENDFQLKFIGQIDRLPEKLQKLIKSTEKETENNKSGIITIAISYGGRAEIVNAVNKILESGKKEITEESFENYLWTKDLPDPDVIIRTGGDIRLSNFLTWQSVYSELYFVSTYWPDFSKDELKGIVQEFSNRERRKGK